MVEKIRVSVPMSAPGARIDFQFPTGVVVLRLPFEALGEAEEIRQHAFLLLVRVWGSTRWELQGQLYEGAVELDPAEVRMITNLAVALADMRAAA